MAKYSNVNDTVQETGIKKYKATANKIDRTAILAVDKKFIAKLHFIEGLGYMHCFGGACCKLGGTAQIRNVYPLVKYPSDEEGNLIPGNIDLQALVINNTKDKSIKLKNKVLESEGKKLSDIDLMITGGEEQAMENGNKYVDYDMDNGGPVSWKKNKVWAEQLKEKWAFYDENIEKSIGKIVKDDNELFELLKLAQSKGNGKTGGTGIVKPTNQQTTQAQNSLQPKQIEASTVIESNVNEDDFFMNIEKEVTKEQTAEVVNTESSSSTFDIFNQ